MAFEFVESNGVPVIVANGTIETGTAEEFARFDAKHGERARYVFLVSNGGVGGEAMDMARTIRERGLKTVVPREGYCLSACPLVLAGGLERVVYPDAWLGLHRASIRHLPAQDGADSLEQAEASMARVMDFLEEMDVDPLVWTDAMRTPVEKIHVMTHEEMIETRIATIVSDNIRLR